MPFKKETVEMIRESFVNEALANIMSFSALCRKYQISRPTGYLWLNRFKNGDGFSDKSHAPFKTPNKTSREMEKLIINTRKKEPALGALKIKRILQNQGVDNLPCQSTINEILNRNNLITREASIAATPYKRFEKDSPNVMWQADFKGHYHLKNGIRCHPLSIIDDHSRYCICADAKLDETLNSTMPSFESSFRTYGLPEIILCDNGNPWGASQSNGVTKFEVWLMELGILTMHITPKRPQTQGKVERFNGSFKKERLNFYTPLDMVDADKQRQEYKNFYNNERPHHALDLDTPASKYSYSKKAYPEKICDWEYSDGYEMRKIKSSGYITYGGKGYFLSEAYGGKTIAVKPAVEDDVVKLYFRQFVIGKINLRESAVISRKIYLRENDPRSSYQ